MQKITIIITAILLSGCAYKVPSYQVQESNLVELKSASQGVEMIANQPTFNDDGSILCRMGAAVSLPDGQTFSGYIASALKSELNSAKLLKKQSKNKLQMTITKVNFSSRMGAANWYIDADYSINGKDFKISTIYNDRSSFVGATACNNMSLYFRLAVQSHLQQLYQNPDFRNALEITGKDNKLLSRDRLLELKKLFEDGLITEQEYLQKREEVLKKL